MRLGKNIKAAKKAVEPRLYGVGEAIALLKEASYVKFDETLDVVMILGVDPKHSDQMVRGVSKLPAGSGKEVTVAVFCKDDHIGAAKTYGADFAGNVELIDLIKRGDISFNVCIATPDIMGVVSQVARILGPKGLMPNPKLGTVTQDIESAVRDAKSGRVEFRVDKNGIIHAGIGKLSFSNADLAMNIKSFISDIIKARPSGAKGKYLRSIYLSSTMGPSVMVDYTS